LLVLLVLLALGAGCAGDRGPDGGPPATIPAVAEEVAAAETGPAVEPDAADEPDAAAEPAAARSAPVAFEPAQLPPDDGSRPSFERPDHVRALYLNAWAAGSRKRMQELIAVARRTEINAFVIDIKDASGFVSHPTGLAVAREIGATGEIRIRDLRGLLRTLEAEGIYPIARIVIVRDPLLAVARPHLTVQAEGGDPWRDDKGIVWMNIAQRGVWDYNVDLAEEVARMGFPEIQWDYVRFPDAPRAVMASARFPGLEGSKADAVRAFLDYADNRLDELDLDVVHTADVFGITTSTKDVGIGQVWERFIDEIDVALPMVYPSHYYRGSFGYQHPNSYPYEIVRQALERALEKSKAVSGAGTVRPYLQDFNLGAPAYGAAEVRAQIQATYDAGIEEWVLWNAGSRYTEAALRPDEGWPQEPRIRVADRVVPVSERFDLLAPKATAKAEPAQEVAPRSAEPSPAPSPVAEAEPAPAPPRPAESRAEPRREPAPPRTATPRRSPDGTQPRVWKPDALRKHIDSLSRARDTIRER
jgi:hypothetical protein